MARDTELKWREYWSKSIIHPTWYPYKKITQRNQAESPEKRKDLNLGHQENYDSVCKNRDSHANPFA